MNLQSLHAILALAPPPQAGQQPDPKAQMIQMLGTFAILGVIFYMMLIRPQQKRAKAQAALLKAIKVGDDIVTSGGVVGRVVGVRENTVTIRSEDTKLEILKSAVAEITKRAGETPEAKS